MGLHPLAGVIEKLRRADTHLEVLYQATSAYMDIATYGIVSKDDAGNGHPGFIYSVTQQPPSHFATIIGDILHNERCALDYLAHELIKLNGQVPTERTQFPICRTEDGFLRESVTRERLRGIAMFALKLISAFQPYRMQGDKYLIHSLWQLRLLSNLDKHRALTISAMGSRCKWSYRDTSGVLRTGSTAGVVYDGSILAEFPFLDKEAKLEVQSTAHVAFRDPPVEGMEALNVLQSIREFIGDLMLPEFAKLFDPLPDDLKLGPNRLSGLYKKHAT